MKITNAEILPILQVVDTNPEYADISNPKGYVYADVHCICAVGLDGMRYILQDVSNLADDVAQKLIDRINAAGEINPELWNECPELAVYGSEAWQLNQHHQILLERQADLYR